ncbi:hypothetical protein HYC85_028665 [Camellia sinensis]|uniref:Uncharacterized protein n=1 Tax=Camellia sinensis TaxID=4442 RepID=A0A7J7FZU3_CAMSI|nr:hypothetical protein HYC85_028665 [Camellia sinensis]
MAKHTEHTSQNKSYMHAINLGKTYWKSKHCFTCQEDMLGVNQVFAEVPHLLAEVWLPRLLGARLHAEVCTRQTKGVRDHTR